MKGFRLTLLSLTLCLLCISAHAADGVLPITVRLISCGPTVEKACQRDSRCCGLFGGNIELAEYESAQALNSIQSFAGDNDVYHELDTIEQSRQELLR